MRKALLVVAMLLLLMLSVSAGWATTNGTIRMTADNYYWLWLNPGVFADKDATVSGNFVGTAGYVGTNWGAAGGSDPANWGTPETFAVNLQQGNNTVLVKAINAGAWTSGNPAALIARILSGNSTIGVTNISWEYSFNYNPSSGSGQWHSPSTAISSWNGGVWATSGNYAKPGGALYNAFNGSSAQWIWSEAASPGPQSSPVWFRTTATVPEPMSIMLGIMGLGSIAGFRKMKKQ